MGDAEITTSQWRLVEVGRIVLFSYGPYSGRLAAIVEIIDHKRVLVDGPSDSPDQAVPRHSAPLANVSLTPLIIPKTPRAIGNGPLRTAWQKEEVEKKWAESNWAQSRERSKKRRALTDFERFKVMRMRKQARFEEKKALAKVKASA
ncbi:hypothetical protein EV356DRAFT_461675 [Viridothelium virens]|uniref:Large ribosomal subunit protein eL14 domain-containing protein n=1 Tax=Viridothelium virens TaxID=1048519 RepID=A0A6A6HIA6_VIRVR|nr:hypothetical protein EV356DRAFT_461675 [Viridothelium virens]